MTAHSMVQADPEAAVQFYLNEGWNGRGWAPYDMLLIGECIFATRRTERKYLHPDAPGDAAEYRERVLDKARQRWMQGFYADPFTQTPRKRRCL
jgi:hypothetical protein